MKKYFIFIVPLAAAIVFFAAFFAMRGTDSVPTPAPLSQEQIAALRVEYPKRFDTPSHGSMMQPILSEIVDRVDTMLYVKVLREAAPFALEVDILGETYAIPYSGRYLEVMRDPSGKLRKGDIIMITESSLVRETYPKMEEGMEFIIPVGKNPESDTYGYNPFGAFYVTKDGYVLAVRGDMPDALEKDGNHVDALLNDLWIMKKNKSPQSRGDLP